MPLADVLEHRLNLKIKKLRAIFPSSTQVMVKFDVAQFISDAIHEQIKNFPLNKAFRFQSYLVYLFLFQRQKILP
jgi:hypothetical protein